MRVDDQTLLPWIIDFLKYFSKKCIPFEVIDDETLITVL